MASQIYIPFLNPVKFVELNRTQAAQYESRHMDDYLFADQLQAWQTKVGFRQKWTIHDAVNLQFESNFGGVQVQVVDCELNVFLTQNATQVRRNLQLDGFFIYQTTISWNGFTPGVYYILLTLGGTTQMISEPQQLYTSLPGSLLFEYTNSKFFGDIIFETGFSPSVRLDAAVLIPEAPGNLRSAYIDQQYNATTLKGLPHRSFNLVIEKDHGAPPWMADMMNWIFSCDNVSIDGKPYAVVDANIEGNQLDPQYPLRAYSIKVQEGINRSSKIVGVSVDPNKRLLITHVIDATIYHDIYADAGSNLITIENMTE